MRKRSEWAIEAAKARRAYTAYQLLLFAAGKPADRGAKVLLVPVRVKL